MAGTAKRIEVVPCYMHDGNFRLATHEGSRILYIHVDDDHWCGTEAEALEKARELRARVPVAETAVGESRNGGCEAGDNGSSDKREPTPAVPEVETRPPAPRCQHAACQVIPVWRTVTESGETAYWCHAHLPDPKFGWLGNNPKLFSYENPDPVEQAAPPRPLGCNCLSWVVNGENRHEFECPLYTDTSIQPVRAAAIEQARPQPISICGICKSRGICEHDRAIAAAAAEPAPERTLPQANDPNAPALTYEQEVHALLYKGVTFGRDLLGYLTAQAKQETGDAKKLTKKVIAFVEEDVERFRALIPEALTRRDARAVAVPEPAAQQESELESKLQNCALMLRRIACSKKTDPELALSIKGLLGRLGLSGSILRAEASALGTKEEKNV
jgi:hypothetical protein